ncbi:MAG TPA: MASE1 domain-containing protein [Terriglobales bacterium]
MHAGKIQDVAIDRTPAQDHSVFGLLSPQASFDQLNRGALRRFLHLLLGSVGIFLAYEYGFQQNPHLLSALWLPDAVLLCCLLFTPARWWWVYVLVSLPVRYYFGTNGGGLPTWQVFANYPNDWLKALVSVYLIRRFTRGPFRLDSLYQFIVFFCVAVVGSPALSAVGGGIVRHMEGNAFWDVWYRWFLSCALVALSVTPALVHWIAARPPLAGARPARYVEFLLLSSGLALASYAAFGRPADGSVFSLAALFAPIPFLIWAAARWGPIGASTGTAVVGILAMLSTRHGRGPFLTNSPADNVVGMQLFLVFVALPMLLLSILISERKRAEESLRDTMHELALSEQHLRDNFQQIKKLSARLVNAYEDERKNISRELHDGVSQQLTGVLLRLTALKKMPMLPEAGREQLDAVLPLLTQVSDGIRGLSRQLHPILVEYVGLTRALQSLCADSRSLHGLEVEFSGCDLPMGFPGDSAICLYRIAQEALRNAAFHSGSQRARVELSSTEERVRLRLTDWGCGFDVERARRKGGLGLISMQERVQSLQGTLDIVSRAGSGTEITAEVPVHSVAA